MNNSMLLTKESKETFIKWLEFQAMGSNCILAQMKKVNLPQAVLDREQKLADAYHLIAMQLANTELTTIEK